MRKATKPRVNLSGSGPLFLLLALLIFNCIVTPNFLSVGTLWNVLLQAFPILIIALGMTLVIATGGIDISVGATMAISAILFAKMLFQSEMPLGAALAGALGASVVFGLFNGIMVSVFNIQPIIVTLILSISGRGIAQQLVNGGVISFYGNKYAEFGVLRLFNVLPVQVLMIAVLAAAIVFITKKTTLGMQLQAIGDNRNASRFSGIHTVGTLIAVYVICALLAGGAAIMETLRQCSADPNNMGASIELNCIAAVTVGGTSMSGGKAKIGGSLVGALIMQVITTMVNMNNIQFEYSLIIKSAIIIAALYLQHKPGRRTHRGIASKSFP